MKGRHLWRTLQPNQSIGKSNCHPLTRLVPVASIIRREMRRQGYGHMMLLIRGCSVTVGDTYGERYAIRELLVNVPALKPTSQTVRRLGLVAVRA